ncbi:hypothetical protein [Geodermatophilus sp. FMUSA9-8]|uniref:hypothetical protein n=1 Tax=Geodermatophilus sp. FMUSA9-8 TaxID=3120155 RepID=UPI00300B70AA
MNDIESTVRTRLHQLSADLPSGDATARAQAARARYRHQRRLRLGMVAVAVAVLAIVATPTALSALSASAPSGEAATPVTDEEQPTDPAVDAETDAAEAEAAARVAAEAAAAAEAAEAAASAAEQLPVAEDAGYVDAVATFGADAVQAALAADARIARIALADCHLWQTGEIDPAMRDLVDPDLLAEVEAELARPDGYPRTLLAPLPADDGNGHALAAAVRGGCDASAPLRSYPGSFNLGGPQLIVSVDRTGGEPALVVAGQFLMNVTLGDVRVSAGQDWRFTSVRGAIGWRLTDVQTGGAHVNWAPPLAS